MFKAKKPEIYGCLFFHIHVGLVLYQYVLKLVYPKDPSPPPMETPDPPNVTPLFWGLKKGCQLDTPNPTSQGFLG